MALKQTAVGWKAVWCIAVMLGIGPGIASTVEAQATDGRSAVVDQDQKTWRIDSYTEVAGSGPERGKNIYYYKCWVCHNAVAEDPGPYLKGVLDRYSEQAVAAKVLNGGPRMPGFTNMTDADIDDLISYLRTEDCCFESREPPRNPDYRAETNPWQVPSGLWGGPTGVVRSIDGDLPEGIKVQLIAPSGVRLTVFTNRHGEYEFPAMPDGRYTLRIATPIPYKAYRLEGVRVSGNDALPVIELQLVPNPVGESNPERSGAGALFGALPPTPEVMAQLSGAEILWNLPGTAQEKSILIRACGTGCHSVKQIFRNRFTEQGWRAMMDRMLGYQANSLVHRRAGGYDEPPEEVETVVKFLARVRGPGSVDQPVRQFPRAYGEATEVVITEYEMPRRLLSIHDTYGDADGNIWYTSHRTPYQGILDPETGIATEIKTPPTPGSVPGTHTVMVDNERGYAWYTQRWAGAYFVRYNINEGTFTEFDTIGGSNFDIAPDGALWVRGRSWVGEDGDVIEGVYRIEPENAEITDIYPLNNPVPYQSAVSEDGRFWAGATPPTTGANTAEMLDIETGTMYEVNTGDRMHSGARGGFEPNGNDAWFGGRDGFLVEVVNEIDDGKGIHVRLYQPPTPPYPYTLFYTAKPDRYGDVWAGVYQDRGFVRYNQHTGQWTLYENPEPAALSRFIWIDNSTNPVTVWYPDFHTGMVVRIRPRPVFD